MFKNPNYLYGKSDIAVSSTLNFGEFVLSKFWENKERQAIVGFKARQPSIEGTKRRYLARCSAEHHQGRSAWTLNPVLLKESFSNAVRRDYKVNGETQESLTFKELAQEAMMLAISLVRMGVRKGDVVAICSENRLEFFSTALGIICTGAVATPINYGYTKDELKHAMKISKPKFLFCSPRAYKTHAKTFPTLTFVKKVIVFGNDHPRDVLSYSDLAKGSGDELDFEQFQTVDVQGQIDSAFLLYSSGTTGLAKGVLLTHLNMMVACVQQNNLDITSNVLMVTPWFHSMGLVGAFGYLAAGRTIIYLTRFEPDLYLKTIETYQVAQMAVAPPVLMVLSKFPSKYNLSSVTMITCGAAPLRADTINAVCARFPNVDTVLQGYGTTECTLAVCRAYYHDKPKIGSAGRVVSGIILKIVDIETRKPLGKYQEGEICVKGPLIMKGYVAKDKREDFDDEGFYKTGDIAYYDDEGYVFIVGRLKELIKYKGFQVPPAEIEAVLLNHEGIRDAGVIGVPDDAAGEVPLAFVVLQPGARLTEDAVKLFVAEKLSSPKHLRGGVKFVSEILKTASGKILRNRLREMVKCGKSKL